MSDDISHKVINIFQRHRRGEAIEQTDPLLEEGGELINTPDGFHYISIKHENQAPNDETTLRETADLKHYIVKLMEVHHESRTVRLNNYHVPGARLQEFLLSLPQRPGTLLEIKQFIPDHMA
jgi:hypothetical protein